MELLNAIDQHILRIADGIVAISAEDHRRWWSNPWCWRGGLIVTMRESVGLLDQECLEFLMILLDLCSQVLHNDRVSLCRLKHLKMLLCRQRKSLKSICANSQRCPFRFTCLRSILYDERTQEHPEVIALRLKTHIPPLPHPEILSVR